MESESIDNLDQLDGVRGLIVQVERFVVHGQRLILRERRRRICTNALRGGLNRKDVKVCELGCSVQLKTANMD